MRRVALIHPQRFDRRVAFARIAEVERDRERGCTVIYTGEDRDRETLRRVSAGLDVVCETKGEAR